MADYKVPSRFIIDNALPMTGLGKINKMELRNLVAKQPR